MERCLLANKTCKIDIVKDRSAPIFHFGGEKYCLPTHTGRKSVVFSSSFVW